MLVMQTEDGAAGLLVLMLSLSFSWEAVEEREAVTTLAAIQEPVVQVVELLLFMLPKFLLKGCLKRTEILVRELRITGQVRVVEELVVR